MHKVFTCTMFGPWLTDNFYAENNLCNVILGMLGNSALLSSQGYLKQNVVDAQICLRQHYKKITCEMLAKNTDMFSQENKLLNVVLICLSQNCKRKLRLQSCKEK